MRNNSVVVILWGVATISLFLSRPGDALVDVKTLSSPQQSVTGGEDIGNTTIASSVILDNLTELSAALLQDEEELNHELSLTADEKGLGKGTKQRCKGQKKVNDGSKRRKSSKNKQKVDVKAKKRQGQRQKPNLQRRKSGQKNKGQETRYKKKQMNKGQETRYKKKQMNKGQETRYKKKQKNKGQEIRYKKKQMNKGQETRYKKKQKTKKKSVNKEGKVKPRDSEKKKTPSGDKKRKKPGNGGKRRCRPKGSSCSKLHGTCKNKCRKKKEIRVNGKCKGRTCMCCARVCKQKGSCAKEGTCRNACLNGETSANYLRCPGSACTCCLPTAPELCVDDSACRALRGSCKAKCDGERVVSGICKGPHCSCCVPPIACDNTKSCQISGGKCKSVCLDVEVRLAGSCDEKGCFCCGPPPTECTQTPICPGTCTQTCRGVVSLEARCFGDFCLCCLDCSPTPDCTSAKGTCKSLCGCGEKELPGGCKGGGCKCCVAEVINCKDTAQCDNCVYTPLCNAEPPEGYCGDVKGCSCCALEHKSR